MFLCKPDAGFSIKSFRHSAFTLIELLTAIAIIALLAAIMFPTFARARENARRSVCQSNLKQIGLGILQYTQDYDDTLPLRYDTTSRNWEVTMQPYMKSYQVFVCPSNEQNKMQMNDDASKQTRVSYIPNTKETISGVDNGGLFAKNTQGTPDVTGVMLASVTTPSSIIAICEGNGPASDFNIVAPFFATMSNCSNKPCLATHHLKTSNFLFADGHVKAMQPEKTLVPTNMWNRVDNAAYSSASAANATLIVQQSNAYGK